MLDTLKRYLNYLITVLMSALFLSCVSEVNIELDGDTSLTALDNVPPMTTNLTPANGTENTQSIITLSYTDADSDLATSCTISSLINITETQTCSCDGTGVCTVGTTGTSVGAGSFDFTVTTNTNTSNASTVSITIDAASQLCPTGFVAVDGNGTLGTFDFCVMKYEAKNDGGGNAVSQAAGNPWVSIEADDGIATNDSDAFEKCANITEAGFSGTFSLISNPEWMTIARDIESVGTNWSSGSVGSGDLARGWSASTSDDGFQNSQVAPTTDPTCVFNSSANTCATTGTHKLRRTHQLSNGSEIWDFSGNVWEWVDWDVASVGFTKGPTDGDSFLHELNDLVGSLTADDVSPSGPYTSVHQAGRYYPAYSTAVGAGLRGGSFSLGGLFAGVFALTLFDTPSSAYPDMGFRCSYRPD